MVAIGRFYRVFCALLDTRLRGNDGVSAGVSPAFVRAPFVLWTFPLLAGKPCHQAPGDHKGRPYVGGHSVC